jgi:heme iron utilization protein
MSTPNPFTPTSYAKPARDLVANNLRGVLAAISDQMYPYNSMVDYAPLANGDVLFLLSNLAEHTRYLQVNPKCSLFIAPSLNEPDAFQKPRLTLVGEVEELGRGEDSIRAFMKYHPRASAYMVMNDFRFWHFHTESARFIGGFGRMAWIEQAEYRAGA